MGGRWLATNTGWSLLGQLLPMAVALVAIPLVVRGMGVSRFGVLSLAWIVIGYFGLFDLGIGRALTKLVAEKLGFEQTQEMHSLIWTSLLMMLFLGVAGGVVLLAISPWLVYRVWKLPAILQTETLHSFYLMSCCIPFVTLTSGLRGVLEGLHCFRLANLIRIPTSAFSFVGPLLVLPFSSSLVWVVAALVLARLIGCLAHVVACFRALPGLRGNYTIDASLVRPLVAFGGWMTVSNLISPILVYIDRFVLGSMISVSLIAFYTAPFDVLTRIMVIPGALANVLFPAFALSLVRDPQQTQRLLADGLKYTFIAIFPATLIAVTLAPEGLRFWLGPSFAENSATVLRWLSAGVLANSLAHLPFALVQSAGRPDLTAKLHMLELVLYLAAVWILTKTMGLEGTAIAWSGRLILDTLLIGLVVQRVFCRRWFLAKLGLPMFIGLLLLYMGTFPQRVTVKAIFLLVILGGFGVFARHLIEPETTRFPDEPEKAQVRSESN